MRPIDIKKTVAGYGVSKARLYEIAATLDDLDAARELRAAGDFIDYATDTRPDAAGAFQRMLDTWQSVPPDK
jgi:hypothetical protein